MSTSVIALLSSDGQPISYGTVVTYDGTYVHPFDVSTNTVSDIFGVVIPKDSITSPVVGGPLIWGKQQGIDYDNFLSNPNPNLTNPAYDPTYDPYLDPATQLVALSGFAAVVSTQTVIPSTWKQIATTSSTVIYWIE